MTMTKQNTTPKKKNKALQKQSMAAQVWHRLLKNKSAVFGLAFLGFIAVLTITANLWLDPELVTAQNFKIRSLPPSAEHWFGTDVYGRDIFARVIYGARYSMSIGIVTTLIGTCIGGLLGAIGAYYGRFLDEAIMRVCDVLAAVPETLLSMCVVAAMGANMTSLIVAMTVAILPGRCRIVRSSVLGVAGKEYVEAARAAGMKDFRIIVTQIIPNSLGPAIITAMQGAASIMLTAASLSYLGVGIQPPAPEWGAIIAAARDYLRLSPYMCVIPGIVMSLTALSFNLLGDGLRDALDPKLKD